MITIINYGIGNLESVRRALRRAGSESVISADPADVLAADGIVLPGVGFFAEAMQNLRGTGLLDALNRKVLDDKTPALGICLGFQMFTRWSEEGDSEGLGWLDAETRRFRFDDMPERPPIPHLGWNDLAVRKEGPLLSGIPADACFYFAHSYYVSCHDAGDVLTHTTYGFEYVSSVQRGNLFGTQFHPEKSHASGLRLLENFVGVCRHA